MKIAIFDPYLRRFTQDMEKWWQDNGHEVKMDRYYDPRLVQWADMTWFDTCDNNLKSAMNPSEGLLADWLKDGIDPVDIHDMDLTGKKIIVRPIDIEIWQGHHADAKLWDKVDHCIFLAPHIKDIMMADSRPQASNMKIHTIQCGVDLDRWTFRKKRPRTKKIAIVAERWVSKGVDYAVQIAMKLPKGYTIHWLGKNNDYHWEHSYLLDIIDRLKLPIVLEEDYVENLDEWLDDKDFLLSCSKKEAFGYNIAEAMAKGITPVIHHFYGAEHIWPDNLMWDSIDQAVEMLTRPPMDPNIVRDTLTNQGYTIDQMMTKIMEAING